jgi:2-keto-4-pentenoate hydratase
MDRRIERGMRAMLELRRARIAGGEQPLGWKVGFAAPAALESLGTDRPLVGFLTSAGLLADGASVPLDGWTAPRLEAEVAVELARDVAGDATWDAVRTAIGGLAPAIELADLDPSPADPEAILAGNIYHRHFVLGAFDRSRSQADGLTGRIRRDGEQIAEAPASSELTGEVVEVVRLVAETLARFGERLSTGDVVITGSVVPPLPVAPGERFEIEFDRLGPVNVTTRQES